MKLALREALFPILFFVFCLLMNAFSLDFESFGNDSDCTNFISESSTAISPSDLGTAMRKGLWSCAKDIALGLQAKVVN
jgi:hypothetical protein